MIGKIALGIAGTAFIVFSQQYETKKPKKTEAATVKAGPMFTADGRMQYPTGYREWIYLTSGLDMSYSEDASMREHSVFDNVFVNPEAYKAFVETGTWPDKTVMVLEIREARNKGSINKGGQFQTSNVMAVEVHVKDEKRFPGKWGFFSYDGTKSAEMIPLKADCYSCHEQHAAVDTTFVQFYPTLLEIAKKKNTLSPAYLKALQAEEKGK